MRWALLLFVLALASCHSHKQVNEAREVAEVKEVSVDSVDKRSKTIQDYLSVAFLCDSISFHLTADSIVTDGKVIYNPTIAIEASKPSTNIEKTSSENQTDSVSQHIEKTDSVATSSRLSNDYETVTIAKPPAIHHIAIAVAMSAAAIILILAIWKHRKK